MKKDNYLISGAEHVRKPGSRCIIFFVSLKVVNCWIREKIGTLFENSWDTLKWENTKECEKKPSKDDRALNRRRNVVDLPVTVKK